MCFGDRQRQGHLIILKFRISTHYRTTEGRKDRRKKGRKEGRKEGKKKGRKEYHISLDNYRNSILSYHLYKPFLWHTFYRNLRISIRLGIN